ncbi:transposase [Micromonospora sediminicola]|uniref:transposase n=1 Tax=Micromonospora sediminicola TaxID=946078 RepID=UPI0033AD12CB
MDPARAGLQRTGERGRKHADDLRTAVDTVLHIAQTACQWRHLPASFGKDASEQRGSRPARAWRSSTSNTNAL